MVEEGTTLSEESTTGDGLSCEEGNPSGFFIIWAFFLQPLKFVPTSRERVFPKEWQVRSVPGECISKAKVFSIQAARFRQYTLISDFLDLANLSVREEATLAKNWINDRPEGF